MNDAEPSRYPEVLPPHGYSLHHRQGGTRGVDRGPTHENPGFELSFVTAGAIEFTLGASAAASTRAALPFGTGRPEPDSVWGGGARRARVEAREQGAILLPPGLLNTPRSRHAIVHQLHLAPSLLDEAADALGIRLTACHDARQFGADSDVSAIARAIARQTLPRQAGGPITEVVGIEADAGIDALVHALAFTLARSLASGRAANETKAVEPAIRRALDYIEVHFAEPLRVDDLARVAELPRFVFLRRFTAQVGESPHRHLTGVRLDRAAAALMHPARSVLAIALDVGFGDPSRFARAFALRFGTTPQRWRRTRGARSA